MSFPTRTKSAVNVQFRAAQLGFVVAAVFGVSFIACHLRNFVLPNVPVLFWSDQMLYATNGLRINSGQMPYRDYFEFLTPGTDLVYAQLFRSLGAMLWIPNLLMDFLAATSVSLITLAGARVLRGPAIALPAVFALGFGLYGGLDATHHWFSTVFALAAMVALLYGTEMRHIICAGALCGVMASFTQSKGAAVTLGFVIYLLLSSNQFRESASARAKKCLTLCASALANFLAINIYFMFKLGIAEWCRWIVVFPFRYYPTMPGQSWRSPALEFHVYPGLLKLLCASYLYLDVPLTYLIFLLIMRRRCAKEPNLPWNRLLLIAITGIAMFLSVAPSLSLMRASAASFPAAILLAWLLQQRARSLRFVTAIAALLSVACALQLILNTQREHWNLLDLPAGLTAIREPAKYELYLWLKDHTHPGQAYLGIAPLSYPLGLWCPAPIQAPGPWEYYRPEHINRSIAALESNRIPLLVLRTDTQFQNTPGYEPEHLRAFHDYVEKHYRVTRRFATGDEVWERIPDQPSLP